MPTRIPNYKSVCITSAEAEIIYQALENDEILSPLNFCKKVFSQEIVRQEYQVLNDMLYEHGFVNPYEYAMFHHHDQGDQLEDVYTPGKQNMLNMIDWSILSTEMHYVVHPRQHDQHLRIMDSPAEAREKLEKLDLDYPTIEMEQNDFITSFVDQFEDVTATLHTKKALIDNRDITTTYLGMKDIKSSDKFKPELKFPIFSNSHTWGTILNGGQVDILLDSGASRCYMSRAYYMRTTSLHELPKLDTNIKYLVVGSGHQVGTLFVIPIVLTIHEHRFELYALVSDIQPNIDVVFGMKNMFEVEGELSCRHSEFRFLNRAVPIFPLENIILKPNQKRYIKFTAPFYQKLSGIAMVKVIIKDKVNTLQVKIQNNLGMLDIVNVSLQPISFTTNMAIGVVDIRSLGYYNIKHQALQYSLTQGKSSYALSPFQFLSENNKECETKASTYESLKPRYKRRASQNEGNPYPWLEKDDERRFMNDEQIIRKNLNLSESILTEEEKEELWELAIKYRKAFSLRDEIGECPNIKVDIDVIDESPFFVRPFPISEEDKPIMDRQMQRLVSLGILSRNTTSHTSPVMLITRKVTKDKRPVVDFRLLNTRIRRQNTATPLLRDIYQMLGKSGSTILSICDIKDAFHSLKLTEKAKDYCGIMPYFGSPHYRYEVMPMGLSISPCKWIECINVVMEGMPNKNSYIAIMDDLLIHSKHKDHMERIEELFKAMIRNGLRLSPKKCQLFRDEVVYMGNIFKLTDGNIIIKPIKTRIDAILNTPAPKTPKECKSFCGVVNYLSLFCPNLQSHLAPIYDLTRKGRPFIWTEHHQKAFDKIKELMTKPPILFLPDGLGRYILCSDTSKTHCGSSLWQIQGKHTRLIGFASKKLPTACQNYSITELEMTGLLYNMTLWRWYLGKKNFDAVVDHRCIPHILKSKNPPTTNRIIRLLQAYENFDFHLYYIKGKDMILADYFSRVPADQDSAEELIPIAFTQLQAVEFNPTKILEDYYDFKEDGKLPIYGSGYYKVEEYKVMSRSQSKAQGLKLPEVHGVHKGVNPDLKPETQVHREGMPPMQKTKKSVSFNIPRTPLNSPNKTPAKITPDRKNINDSFKSPIFQTPMSSPLKTSTPFSTPLQSPIIKPLKVKNERDSSIKRQLFSPIPEIDEKEEEEQKEELDSKFQPPLQSILKPQKVLLPETPAVKTTPKKIQDIQPTQELDPNIEIPLHDTSVEAMFRPPEMADFILPPTLKEYTKNKHIVASKMPRQTEIDKLMKHINRKILRNTRYPESMKDLEAAYLSSGAFRDIYQYLRFNKLPVNKKASRRVECLALDYFTLGSLLFKKILLKGQEDYTPVLCIPPSRIDNILDYYHSTVIGGHQGMTKTLKTLSEKFFCPRMADYIRAYIIGCHVCQLFKDSKRFHRPFHKRYFDISTPSMSHVSMDIKYMINGYLLLIICEISNFIIVSPMGKIKTETICKILFDEFISIFGSPIRIQCDQDPAFMSTLCQFMMQQYGVKMVTCSPTNHKSLYAEHGIKSLSNLLIKDLSGLGTQWSIFCKPCQLIYNTAVSPNLADMSPFELVFGRQPRICPEFEITPAIPVTGTLQEAKDKIVKTLKFLRLRLLKFREKRYEMMNKDKAFHGYTAGQIVYLFFPGNSILNTGSKKITCHYVGPLAIWKCFSPTQFVLMSLDGVIYPFLIEETRIKPGVIRSSKGPITTLAGLRQLIKEGYVIKDDSPLLTTIEETEEYRVFPVQAFDNILLHTPCGDLVPPSEFLHTN